MKFILNNDKLKIQEPECKNSGSINYYLVDVEFNEEWEGLNIEGRLTPKEGSCCNNDGRAIAVINNKLFIDNSINGYYAIGFIGFKVKYVLTQDTSIDLNKTYYTRSGQEGSYIYTKVENPVVADISNYYEAIKDYQISTNLQGIWFNQGAGEIEVTNDDIPTPSQWEIYIEQIQNMIDGLEGLIPTKLSQLQNDNHTVQDENYVHTDNNFSNEDKDKLDDLENYDDTEIKADIEEINGDIDEINTNLLNYSLITETGSKIDLEINSSTYELVAKLYDKNNNLISTSRKIDLPIESMVVSGFYDSVNKKIILTLDNGNTIDIPVGDLISGLQAEITSENKLESDLVDDTNQTNKFVTTQEKEIWNDKLDESDLADYVTNDTLEDSQAIQDEKTTAIEKQIPTGEVNDTSITLTDSADYWVKEFGIEGNTEQATRSGKNKLNLDLDNIKSINTQGTWNNNIYSYNGINYIINDDYSITVSGTASGASNLILSKISSSSTDTQLESNTQYKLLGCPSGGAVNKYSMRLYDGVTYESDVGSGLSFVYSTQTTVRLNVYSGTTVSNLTFYPMILLATETDNSYEPYGASPSPEYSSPVNNITGDVEVKVQNKNLLKINNSTKTINGITFTVNDDKSITINGTATSNAVFPLNVEGKSLQKTLPLKANTNYAMSIISEQSMIGIIFQGYLTKNGSELYPQGEFITSEATLMGLYLLVSSGRTINNVTVKPQLEEGIATPYTPHQEQNYPISLGDIELVGKQNFRDELLKNTNWYKKGVFGKVILDGTTDNKKVSQVALHSNTGLYYCVCNHVFDDGQTTSGSSVENLLCDYFQCATGVALNHCYRTGNGSTFVFILTDQTITTVEQANAWLSSHNVTVYYPLATPVITPITDTTLINQLNALEQAYTYKGVTHIDTDVETKPYLKVVYRKDIGLILERIENLEARVSLLE